MSPTKTPPVATETIIRIEATAPDEAGVTDILARLRTAGWMPARRPVRKDGDVVCAPEKIALGYSVVANGRVEVALDMTAPAGLDMPMMMLAAIPTLATEAGALWGMSLGTDGRWTVTFVRLHDASVVSLANWKAVRGCRHRSR